MKFEYFEKLTPAEAADYLRHFLEIEGEAVTSLLAQANADGLRCDHSIDSIAPLFRWVLKRIQTISTAADPKLPNWILDTPSYTRGLFEFDEPSKAAVLRMAYYMGSSFVGTFPCLKWAIGDTETAERNMPVVTGFNHDIELAPIMVMENLFRRAIADSAPQEDVDRAINLWVSDVPSASGKRRQK